MSIFRTKWSRGIILHDFYLIFYFEQESSAWVKQLDDELSIATVLNLNWQRSKKLLSCSGSLVHMNKFEFGINLCFKFAMHEDWNKLQFSPPWKALGEILWKYFSCKIIEADLNWFNPILGNFPKAWKIPNFDSKKLTTFI
jgi:hypothetical protein